MKNALKSSLVVLVLISLAAGISYVSEAPPALVDSYRATAPKIVIVCPYERAVPTLMEAIASSRTKKKLKPKPFMASLDGSSGVIVSKTGVILTAAHVVRRSPVARIRTLDGQDYDVAVVARDKGLDLALLVPIRAKPKGQFSVARIGRQRPSGWPVYTLGNPSAMKRIITLGVISGFDGGEYVSDAFIDFGSSGGGLFDATTGDLLGITIEVYKGYSFSATTDNIHRFVNKYIDAI